MAELYRRNPWTLRLAFLSLALVLILFQLLPLETTARRWAGPDILTALALCWSLRRPDAVPVWLLAAVFLLADMLFQRPPGLWAALVVVGGEWLRTRGLALRGQPFASEWMTIALVLIAITFANRFALALSVVPLPPLTLVLIQLGMTAVSYPVVVLVSRFFFGVRAAGAGEPGGGIGT